MTNQELIDQALQAISIVEAGNSANTTDSATALNGFNRMMAEWPHSDRDFNFPPQDTLGDTAPIPTWAEEGIISNLAVRLAPEFRVPISFDLAEKAKEGRNVITRTLMNLNVEEVDLGHLPQGQIYHSNILTDT